MRTLLGLVLATASCEDPAPSQPPSREVPPTSAQPTAPKTSTTPASASPARENPPPEKPQPLPHFDPALTHSLGSPIEGSLEAGVAMPEDLVALRRHPNKKAERGFGTAELINAIVRASAQVQRDHPGIAATIGDISAKEGGPIGGHASHQSGRDIDVYFFLLDAQGKARVGHPIPLDPEGKGTDYRDLQRADDDLPVSLDLPRTWAFYEALMLDPQARVQRLFLAEHLRHLLLEHAREIEAPKAAIERFSALTCQPRFPHDDHVHIRFFCSPEDIRRGCEDTRPIYPWHKEFLSQAGVRPRIAGPRTKARPKLRSTQQARAQAGPMHPSVVEFLDRRQKWAKKPHPGRPYCK